MTALAASDVTVTITKRWIASGVRHSVGTIGFGNGSLTYPTAGVPLPAVGKFGMIRNLDSLNVFGVNGLTTDYVVKYNKAAHKLSMFEEEAAAAGGPLLECDTSEAPAARVYDFIATGW